MSQILLTPIGMDWFRMANKYLENLYKLDVSNYGNVTVVKNQKDQAFIDEFDYIISNMGF